MHDSLNQFLLITNWLYAKIYENSIFFIDLWSVNHLLTGILIMLAFFSLNVNKKLFYLFLLLFTWEIFELAFLKVTDNVFYPESLKDQVTDILLGFVPGLITYYFLKHKKIFENFKFIKPESVAAVFTAVIIAFLWVGSYHYHYSVTFLNTPFVNLWALTLWVLGYLSILRFYTYLELKIRKLPFRVIILWLVYFCVLFTVEYIGRYIVEIKEVSSPTNTPLIFNLIYGNIQLHFVYTFAPIIALSIFLPMRKMIIAANKN